MAENAELGPVKMKGKIGQNEAKKNVEKPQENGPSAEMQNAMAETMENVEKEKEKVEEEIEEKERFFGLI